MRLAKGDRGGGGKSRRRVVRGRIWAALSNRIWLVLSEILTQRQCSISFQGVGELDTTYNNWLKRDGLKEGKKNCGGDSRGLTGSIWRGA